ncbi:ComEC/Rec2 family competence protein [Nocardia fluminea]|uniref:ComEC/Rec2 family competence protein n=1 Tax=Nocardia fluminea TaxID=134984 RepID=UPI0033C4B52B
MKHTPSEGAIREEQRRRGTRHVEAMSEGLDRGRQSAAVESDGASTELSDRRTRGGRDGVSKELSDRPPRLGIAEGNGVPGELAGRRRWTRSAQLREESRREAGRRVGSHAEAGEVEPEQQVLDMRLVPAALGCWAATIVAVTVGWVAGLVLAAVAVVGAIGLWAALLWAVAHRRERWRVVAVTGLATMLLGAGFAVAGAWQENRVQAHPLRESFGRSVNVLAVVTDDAKPLRAGGFGGERRWIVRASLREFGQGPAWTQAGGSIVVLAQGSEWAALSPGQPVRFRAEVGEPNRADLTVATLHATDAPKRIGEPPWWQRRAVSVRTDLVNASAEALPPAAAGLLPALVVGDTVALPGEVRDAFEIAGLQHLCVVSGANFTILLTALLALTRLLTAGPRASAAAAAGAVVLFVVIARPDPSVLRAAAMGSVTVLALLTGRRKQALPALCAAVIGLLAIAPELAVSAGFALSVLATAGLILLAPSWADWLRARGWWRGPAEIVAVSAAAFIVTVPLMVALTGRVSLVSIVANALVAPVVGLITVIGAVGAVVACVWGDAAVWVLWCARPPMWWLLGVADHAAAVPGATVTVPGGAVGGSVATVIVVMVVAALRWSQTRRLLAVVALGVSIVLLPVRFLQPGWPPTGWVLAMCDVGQGDGLALSVAPGSALVVDVGPDPRPIRACLDRLEITHIPLLVLTHPHADHINGLAGALRGRTVDAIATAPGELRSAIAETCAAADRTAVPTPAPGSGQPVKVPGQVVVPMPGAVPTPTAVVRPATVPGRPVEVTGRVAMPTPVAVTTPGPVPTPPNRTAPSGDSSHPTKIAASPSRPTESWPRAQGVVATQMPATDAAVAPAGPDGSGATRSHSVTPTMPWEQSTATSPSRERASTVGSAVRRTQSDHVVCPRGTPGERIAKGDSLPAEHEASHRESHGHGDDADGVERVAELAGVAGIPLMELHAGHEMTFGAVGLRVLAPSRDVPTSLAADEANDRSLVLRARTPAGTILFTGDIESEAQVRMMRGADVRADILKVPHHGSRTTTTEFLRAVAPRLALVSAGSDNTFGHPHPTVTTALAALGATVARTDLDGDVVIVGAATDLRTVTSRRRASRMRHGPAPGSRRGSRFSP